MSRESLHIPHNLAHDEGTGAARHTPSQWAAIFSAIVATLGAVLGYQSNVLMRKALLPRNEAALKKAQASDEWSECQAISTTSHLAELAQQLISPQRAAQFTDKTEKYRLRKESVKAKAQSLDRAAQQTDDKAHPLSGPHQELGMAMVLLEIAVAIASITALTHRGWRLVVATLNAASGTPLALHAWL